MRIKGSKYKRKGIAVAAAIIIVTAAAVSALLIDRSPDPPLLAASSYALIDLNNDKTLYEHEPAQKLKLGSLTKLMPLYICFQELERNAISLDDTVTVSAGAAAKSGSVARLPQGSTLSLDNLLYCLLLPSGNDAAVALSEFICGSENAMVKQMNATAAQLGMSDTRYTDCAGTDSFDNRSTTRDLTLLVRELLSLYPKVVDYTSIPQKTVSYMLDGETMNLTLNSTNRMLNDFAGVYGLKTGTAQNTHNAIVLAKQGRSNLMAIVLDAPNDSTRWLSVRMLLEYGFEL
jgi:D-alanyl-D-alanine carboxypeptidase (penicillin-binding protein 5/6)